MTTNPQSIVTLHEIAATFIAPEQTMIDTLVKLDLLCAKTLLPTELAINNNFAFQGFDNTYLNSICFYKSVISYITDEIHNDEIFNLNRSIFILEKIHDYDSLNIKDPLHSRNKLDDYLYYIYENNRHNESFCLNLLLEAKSKNLLNTLQKFKFQEVFTIYSKLILETKLKYYDDAKVVKSLKSNIIKI